MNPLCIFVLVFLSHVRVGLAFTYNTTRGLPILVAPYDKKTFWVDKSCTDRRGKNGEPVWDNILGDTIEMACAVKKSLSHSPVDTDFAQVFWILFNVEVTDERRKFPMSSKYQQRFINHDEKTAKAMVLGMHDLPRYDTLHTLTISSDIVTDLCDNWSQIPSGDQSTPSQVAQTYLRIYCDNALASEGKLSSSRPSSRLDLKLTILGKRLRKLPNGRIADVNNAMLDTADCGSEEIVLNGKKKTLYTNAFTHSKAMERDSQNPDRAVVTLCDIAFENSVVLKDFDPQKDWQAFKGAKDNILKVRVGPFRMLTSFTMLHEVSQVGLKEREITSADS